jgi:hypothetical protein
MDNKDYRDTEFGRLLSKWYYDNFGDHGYIDDLDFGDDQREFAHVVQVFMYDQLTISRDRVSLKDIVEVIQNRTKQLNKQIDQLERISKSIKL